MIHKKNFSISGTLITLIIVYLIYKIAKSNNWGFLSFITGAYLIVVIGFVCLIVLAILLLVLIPIFILKKPFIFKRFGGKHATRSARKEQKIDDDAIDVEFKVKE